MAPGYAAPGSASLTLLGRQAAAFRLEHSIPEGSAALRRAAAPSILFSPEEAKGHDAEAVATLARRGLASMAALDPDAAGFVRLFEGPPHDREQLTAAENERLNREIRRLLLLLSPHLMLRAAQECMEGLLHRYQVHRWNVDDVIACALPYHDSPLFTCLLQGLHVAGKPRWSWLQSLKDKPTTLVRPALAKYCAKDLSVLAYIGEVLQETAVMQKSNRPLSVLFTAVWLDALASVDSPGQDLVLTALPPMLAALRRPHLRDVFHAAVTVGGALCVKVELDPGVKAQLLERAARHVSGELGLTAVAFLALVLQLQASEGLPEKALENILVAGSGALIQALPEALDCSNFLAVLAEACILRKASGAEGEGEEPGVFVQGLLSDPVVVDRYGSPITLGLLQAFEKTCVNVDRVATDAEQQSVAAALRKPLKAIGARQPLALSAALTKAVDSFSARGAKAEILAQLLAPEGDSGSGILETDGTIVDVIRAFSDESPKKRCKAVLRAVADLEQSVKSESDDARQRVLVSLCLQSALDEDLEVAKKTLQLESFWANLPQADAATTIPFLVSLLDKLLPHSNVCGASLVKMCRSVLFGDRRTRALVPLVLRCCCHVYNRSDCDELLRRSLDMSLLPLLVLCIVGLDLLATMKDVEALDEFRAAVLQFCAVSQHTFCAQFKDDLTFKDTLKMAPGAIVPAAKGLCNLVEGRPWAATLDSEGNHSRAESAPQAVLGGKATQIAAVAFLADTLPGLLQGAPNDVERLVVMCASACELFAQHQSYMQVGDCDGFEVLCKLSQVVVSGVTAANAAPKKQTRMRRKSKSNLNLTAPEGDLDMNVLQQAMVKILRVALERPRSMTAVVRGALRAGSQLLWPALLQLALAPEKLSRSTTSARVAVAVTLNALCVLHGLISSKDAVAMEDWAPDQCLLMPILTKLSSTGNPEIRKALFALLELLRDVDWSSLSAPSWESTCAVSLQKAGLLRSHQELLSPKGWAAIGKEDCMLAGLPGKSLQEFIEHLCLHKAGILQDGAAVGTALSHSLVGKGGIVKAARVKDCAFWAVGLSMLVQQTDNVLSPLMAIVPTSGFLASLKEPLCKSLEEMVAGLSGQGIYAGETPLLLRTAALKFSELVFGGRLPAGMGEKAEAAAKAAVGDFVEQLVLPLCSALSSHYEKKLGPLPQSVVDLACLVIACLPESLKARPSPELQATSATELLRLCIASSPVASTKEVAPEENEKKVVVSVFAAAHSAFVSMPMEAPLLCQILKSSSFKANAVDGTSRRVALEAVYQHIVGFDSVRPGSATLLVELGGLAKREVKAMVEANSSHEDGPVSFAMLAIAALSEQIESFGDTASDINMSAATVCSLLTDICKALGPKLTTGLLATILRSCNALVSQVVFDSSSVPPPVLTCVEALSCFQLQLTPDVLGLLKVSLWRFWKYPEHLSDDIVKQEKFAQSRVRLLLQTMLARCRGLVSEVTSDLCLSLVRSAGLNASLDFAVLLVLARRPPAGEARKQPVKRKAKGENPMAQELLSAAGNDEDELAIDEATAVFTSVGTSHRFHGVGTLAQTLSCLALELCRPGLELGKNGQQFWGPSLLPDTFVQDVGKERSFWVLGMCLATMHRLIEEHGLPEGLDDVKVDATSCRGASTESPQDAIESDKTTAALALCYVVKATCVIETLLDGALGVADAASASAASCKEKAKQLRELLLRSLAVNHPQTFFQALCFGLQIEGLSRPPGKKDLLAKEDFIVVEVRHLLTTASEALRKRRAVIAVANESADDADLRATQALCAPLCTEAMRHVCENMLKDNDSVVNWRFLEGLCQFSGRVAPKPVLELCVPAAARCLQAAVPAESSPSVVRSGVACCLCLHTTVQELGRGILPCLASILPAVLDVVGSCGARKGADQDLVLLDTSALQLLQALIKTVGAFLSPYLERIFLLLTSPAPPQRVLLLQSLGKELVAAVPHRLLLPALQSGVNAAARRLAEDGGNAGMAKIDTCLINLQRFGMMLVSIFSVASPEFVSSCAEAATDSIVRLLAAGSTAAGRFLHLGGRVEELPTRVLRRDLQPKAVLILDVEEVGWAEWCSESSVLRLLALGAAAFTQLSLRLSLDDLKPRFVKILDWSRNLQTQSLARQSTRKASATVDLLTDADEACRVLALCSTMQGLACEAPEISEELFLPLALKDLVCCLAAAQRQALHLASQHRATAKRRRRALVGTGAELAIKTTRSSEILHGHTWWWFEVMQAALGFVAQSLQHAGGSASQTKVVDEAVEALVEPVSDALAICEFLPSLEESGLTRAFLEAIQKALVALAAASDGQRVKRLLTAVLSKSRGEDPELRLCAVKACHRIWADIGVQAVSGLSEVLMFAVELLEDEDPRVESAVRSLVKTMEGCTGESLQEHLKQ